MDGSSRYQHQRFPIIRLLNALSTQAHRSIAEHGRKPDPSLFVYKTTF